MNILCCTHKTSCVHDLLIHVAAKQQLLPVRACILHTIPQTILSQKYNATLPYIPIPT